ncbi:MAG: hypothetical protein LBL71_02930 [Endomicrobium sp.]|nr:hypothetical protein [Endomicrobium sp.]
MKEHKEYKKLGDIGNLQDYMNPIELALTISIETAAEELTKIMNYKGFKLNKKPAKERGKLQEMQGKSWKSSWEDQLLQLAITF